MKSSRSEDASKAAAFLLMVAGCAGGLFGIDWLTDLYMVVMAVVAAVVGFGVLRLLVVLLIRGANAGEDRD